VANRTLELRSAVPELSRNSRIGRQDGPARLVVSEMTGLSVVSIAARKGQSGSLQGAVKKLFKIELPNTPRRVEAGGVAFLWAGPDQWIAITDMAAHPDFDREWSQNWVNSRHSQTKVMHEHLFVFLVRQAAR